MPDSRWTAVPLRVIAANLLIAVVLVVGCRDDGVLPTGPKDEARPAFDIEPNGGYVPTATVTEQGSIETILIDFTIACDGCRLDGSPYGVGFGDGDVNTWPGETWWNGDSEGVATNPPSPVHWATSSGYSQTPNQSFLEFDPPVRSVDFLYGTVPWQLFSCHSGTCADSFDIKAYTRGSDGRLGFLVDRVRVPPNNVEQPMSVWDPVQLTSSTDQIAWVYFDAGVVIDELGMIRAVQPDIVCDTVQRGQTTACRITETVDGVSGWRFDGTGNGGFVDLEATSSSTSTTWEGVAVNSGAVSALVTIGGIADTLSGWLEVLDRTGAAWVWGESVWAFNPDSPTLLCVYNPYELPSADSVRLGVNRRASECDSASLEPSLRTDPTGGYSIAQVLDGGPNDSFWYVTTAQYYMDRVTAMNPYIRDGGATKLLTDPNDETACRKKKAAKTLGIGPNDPVIVSFYQYNTVCQNFDLTPLYDGIWAHEGFGTKGEGIPDANGHEARRQYKAAQPDGNPYAAAEPWVAKDTTLLHTLVGTTVQTVENVIDEFAGDHDAVQNNYVETKGQNQTCGSAWVYHIEDSTGTVIDRYEFIEITQEYTRSDGAQATACI